MSSSDDIVERLRRFSEPGRLGPVSEMCSEAADEIERLRAELETCQQRLWHRIEMSDG